MVTQEKFLYVQNNKYPFGESHQHSAIRVKQKQTFLTVDSMLEKKSEMLRKQQIINNSSIISLLSIFVEGNSLIYQWQFVPHSISSYLRSKYTGENNEIWEMTKKLLVKKITYQITVLISFLSKMRIQTELSMQTIGVNHDQKIKLYLSPRSKMGIRSQLFLISQYGQAKQRILKQLHGQLELMRNDPTNPNFKGTRPYFQSKLKNGSLTQSIQLDQFIRPQEKASNISEKKPVKQKQQPIKRKMSVGNFDLGNLGNKSQYKDPLRCSRIPKYHKQSFQLNSSRNFNDQSMNTSYFQTEKDKPINHSKTIKIELEQKQNLGNQRKRKDSYKVKITTCRQYELQDTNLLNENGDIFEYFAARAKKEEQASNQGCSFEAKQQRQQRQGLNTTAAFTPPPSPLLPPNGSSQTLQERVKLLRQRSEKLIMKMKQMKK